MPQNDTKVKEEFKNEYLDLDNIPNSTIKHLINEFEKMGLVHNTLSTGRKKVQLMEVMPTISSCLAPQVTGPALG